MGARIDVDNADLRRALREIGDSGLKKTLREANKSAAEVVVEKALPKVPVRSGRLRRSVKALAGQKDAKVKAGTKAVPYAAAIHWGRKRGNVGTPPGNRLGGNVIPGRPFLWDAAQQARPEAVAVYEREMAALLNHVRGR